MKRYKIYIAGKITGLDQTEVVAKFARAQDELQSSNYEVVNPKKLYQGSDWDEAMNICLKALKECQAIYMLSDWKNSKGAKIEHDLAKESGMIILYQSVEQGHPTNMPLQKKYEQWRREH